MSETSRNQFFSQWEFASNLSRILIHLTVLWPLRNLLAELCFVIFSLYPDRYVSSQWNQQIKGFCAQGPFRQSERASQMVPMPAVIRREAEYTLDRSSVHHRSATQRRAIINKVRIKHNSFIISSILAQNVTMIFFPGCVKKKPYISRICTLMCRAISLLCSGDFWVWGWVLNLECTINNDGRLEKVKAFIRCSDQKKEKKRRRKGGKR